MSFHNADEGKIKAKRATRFSSRFKGDVNVGEQEAWEPPAACEQEDLTPLCCAEKEDQRAGLLSQWQFSEEILVNPYASNNGISIRT